jgi:choline kinase
MDADVVYDNRLVARLLQSKHHNCFLLDRNVEAGEEPVKLCVRGGHLVEFRKHAQVPCDYYGESVGFFRLSSEMAEKLADRAGAYITQNRLDQPYEEAIRDVLLAEPSYFGFEEVTGVPWIEIDFQWDVDRAHNDILPKLL